jgi:hypothetical protein
VGRTGKLVIWACKAAYTENVEQGEGRDGVEPLVVVPEPEAMAPALLPEPAAQVDRRVDAHQPTGGGAAGVRAAGAGVLPTDRALLQQGQREGSTSVLAKEGNTSAMPSYTFHRQLLALPFAKPYSSPEHVFSSLSCF